jgi:two-component system phosphate regulon sensor histidine kinase PhoR
VSFLDIFLLVLVILVSVGILLYFISTGIKIDKQSKTIDSGLKGNKQMTQDLAKELTTLNIPAETAHVAAKRISTIVDQEVHQKTEYIRVEMKNTYEKALVEKEQTLNKIKVDYDTVQKNYEKIGKQKKQTENVVRSMAKGLVVVNDKGEVLFVNPVAEKILGVKPQSLVGKSITNAKGEHVITMMNEDGLEERSVAALEQDNNAKDILKESTAIIETESGQTKGMVSILTGTTQLKKADEIKTEFVANISHEFRTPLICIQKSLMAVRDELKNLDESQMAYFDIALRNAKRLEKMVNDILDISKIESGKMVLRPELFSVYSFVQDIKNTFAVWARDKNIELVTEVSDDHLAVEADQERLAQVLTNLVSNALKFTPRSGKVMISAKQLDEKTARKKEDIGFVEIGVRDTGPGLSEEDKKKLFQKFSQASTIATGGEKGSGLGLTIAKQIVTLHNGQVIVESEAGKGSYFGILIPQRPLSTRIPAAATQPTAS